MNPLWKFPVRELLVLRKTDALIMKWRAKSMHYMVIVGNRDGCGVPLPTMNGDVPGHSRQRFSPPGIGSMS